MTRRTHVLVALSVLLGWTSLGLAQVPDAGPEPTPTDDPAEATTDSTESEVPPPPGDDVVEEPAADGAEEAPSPAVVATPAPEPEPEPQGPALGDEHELLPPGDEALAGSHPVDAADILFVPGKGLRVTSADDRFRLEVRARVQIAWEGTGPDGGPWGQQVRLRRARLQLAGFMFSEDVRFKMELAVSPNDMGIRNNLDDEDRVATRSPLLDFYIDFTRFRDFQFRVGQYKIPSNRQRVISSGNLQLVDRSIYNGEFTLDRDVGFDLRSKDFLGLERLRYYLGLYIARGRGARGVDDFGMMYLSRIEYLPFGLFNDYSEVDFERVHPRLSIGAGYTHIDRARRDRGIIGSAPADGGTTDTHHIFADAIFKWAGFSSIVELGWRQGDRIPGNAVDDMGNPIPVEDPRNGIGGNIQAGFLIPRLPLEIAGRYSFLRGIGTTSLGDANELTGGVSYYPGRHPYKVQLDYSRLWADSIDEGGHRIRLQLQVAL
ncbi:MAG: hypothetical protein JJ863_32940 [Deltaproteobacteria bacterium]|nr:hypothetical protein [Deltaproteobacteria bacterium]